MRALATYQYVIATKAGKELKGAITADTRELAIQKIKEEGNLLISISEQSVLNKDVEISFLQKKPKPRDMSVFCRQFVSITEAGVPVISALEMLCEQTENKMLRRALMETKLSIEKGETLAEAMRRNKK
ncbi:MAG: type II secretion system F family protein, partial [Clostridia bacterium]|nr:type II secretion system F family protein [Clostridia bacterium]